GVGRAIDSGGEHHVGCLIAGEVAGVDFERCVLRCRVGVVQAQVARDEVRVAVAVKIAGCDAEPPPAIGGKACRRRHVSEATPLILQELNWHPLAYGDEAESTTPTEHT